MPTESPSSKPYVTKEEYLVLEERADSKSEYYAGKVVSMAGGTIAHNTLALNTINSISNRLKDKPCRVFGMDVKVELAESYAYPDAFALCEEVKLSGNAKDIVKNPSLIVEVLSPSTEADDRGRKFQLYRKLPSFKEYVLISQSEYLVEVFFKISDSEWRIDTYFKEIDVIKLYSLDLEIPMLEIYSQVELTPS